MRAYCTFASKHAVSITLFGPRPNNEGSMCQVFLAETVETGNIKKRCVIMFCEESLGKIKFRAFPKRVGPRIVSLESVDYFGISEHY